MLGLPLVQHGICLGLRFDFVMPTHNGFYHTVDRLVFDVDTTGSPDWILWDDKVVENWITPRYTQTTLRRLSVEQRKNLMDLPKRAFMWSAQRMDKL